jgi:ankyrin repeat protein
MTEELSFMLTRRLSIVFATFVFGTASLVASTTGKSYLSGDKSPLRLTLAVLDQKYCAAYEDMDMLHAQVRLTFTNLSSHPLILYRGSSLVAHTQVSKSAEEAASGKHELDAEATWIMSGPSTPRKYGKTPDDAFTILPSGGTFATNAIVGFAVARTDEAPPHMIRPGMHVLQVVVRTWPESAERAKELAARWAASGRLWYTTIRSEPVVLQVGSERSVEECSKYAGLLEAAKHDPNAADPESGITALMAAIENNDLELFDNLLERGANVNATAPGGFSALILAAGRQPVYLKRLIEGGANVSVRTTAGQTPLTAAVSAGQRDNVELLIAAGAFVETPGENGMTPLKLATRLLALQLDKQRFAEIVEVLKRAGAKN